VAAVEGPPPHAAADDGTRVGQDGGCCGGSEMRDGVQAGRLDDEAEEGRGSVVGGGGRRGRRRGCGATVCRRGAARNRCSGSSGGRRTRISAMAS
jgi:hypothetical protein